MVGALSTPHRSALLELLGTDAVAGGKVDVQHSN